MKKADPLLVARSADRFAALGAEAGGARSRARGGPQGERARSEAG